MSVRRVCDDVRHIFDDGKREYWTLVAFAAHANSREDYSTAELFLAEAHHHPFNVPKNRRKKDE